MEEGDLDGGDLALEVSEDELRARMRRTHQEEFAPNLDFGGDTPGSTAQCKCGREPVFRQDVDLYENAEEGDLYALGLRQCNSIWCCPRCARRICRQKAAQLEEWIEEWRDRGGYVYLVNLTTSHHEGHRLEFLLDAIGNAWSYVRSGSPWDRLTEYYGVEHYVQTTEVTHGGAGWHPHKHVLLLCTEPWSEPVPWREPEGGTGEDTRDTGPGTCLGDRIFQRWKARLTRLRAEYKTLESGREKLRNVPMNRDPDRLNIELPLDPPNRENGVRVVGGENAGTYVSKVGLGNESVRMDTKEAKGSNRTPFEILRDYMIHGRDKDARRWREYAEAMHGRAHSYASQGLEADLDGQLEADLEEPDDEDDPRVLTVDGDTWGMCQRRFPHGYLLTEVKRIYRERGVKAVVEELRDLAPLGWELLYDEDRAEIWRRRESTSTSKAA